ncbi:MAG: protein translocase subunit SecD [Bacillota bacterium]|nr:protein translocase subunit SecD [Bacillota bacterium]
MRDRGRRRIPSAAILAAALLAVLAAVYAVSPAARVTLGLLGKPVYAWPAGIAVLLFLANYLTGGFRARRRSTWRLAAVLLAIACLGYYLGFVNPILAQINQGLDLKGGVHVVLEAEDIPGSPVTEEAMQTVQAILEARVNGLGVAEPRVERSGARRIIVELPGIADPERALADIGRTAYLEFVEGFDLYLVSAGDNADGLRNALREELGLTAAQAGALIQRLGEGPQLLKAGLDYAPLIDLAEAVFDTGASVVEDPRVILTGADLAAGGARAAFDQNNRPIVSLTFTAEGAQKFADLTTRRVNRPIYILLDRQLVQAPTVSEAITSGRGQITGYGSYEDAFRVAVLLNSGALPVKLVALAPQVVSATLGADSIARSKTAGIISIAAVIGFMLLFYQAAGLLANLALALYIMLVLVALAGINATLTLPGVAGLLLSVGMAVDANVITFERVREELRLGKTVRSAIESGFSRALGTIVDANLTTLIAAGVLFYLGSGPVRGFAVTLAVGIVVSMLTAVFITRYLLRLAVGAGWLRDPRWFLGSRQGSRQGSRTGGDAVA